MYAWLSRILLVGLVSMPTLQDVFLDLSWQGTYMQSKEEYLLLFSFKFQSLLVSLQNLNYNKQLQELRPLIWQNGNGLISGSSFAQFCKCNHAMIMLFGVHVLSKCSPTVARYRAYLNEMISFPHSCTSHFDDQFCLHVFCYHKIVCD